MSVARQSAARLAGCVLLEEEQKLWRPVHRLNRAETQTGKCGVPQYRIHQVAKGLLRAEISAPAAEVDTGKHQFDAAGGGKLLYVAQAGFER